MTEQLTIKLGALLDVDEDTKKDIKAFTESLERIPQELDVYVILDDKRPMSGRPVKLNIGNLLIEQVKRHFGK